VRGWRSRIRRGPRPPSKSVYVVAATATWESSARTLLLAGIGRQKGRAVSPGHTDRVSEKPTVRDHYGAHYRDFAADVHEEVRRAAFGDDVGQNSWLTRNELERFGQQLELSASSRLLDVACGSGGPALHLAQLTGCQIVGVELFDDAVANGRRIAREAGLEKQANFARADASQTLPFDDGSFDAILCIDAINHLPDRRRVLTDWARLLHLAGRLLFTDPVTITGPLDSDELAIRTSVGYYLFVPPGENERRLAEAGMNVLAIEDTTDSLAEIAGRRRDARRERADALRQVEGDEAFEGRQRFFDIVARLAHERRLSRLVYTAEKVS
jgi:SAM-dependent methyltransferase